MSTTEGEKAEPSAKKTLEIAFHAKSVDPVFDEIDRILVILQNEDGSWGTSDSLDERLYQTAWVIRSLHAQRLDNPLNKTINLLMQSFISQIEKTFQIGNFTHLRKLYGLTILLPLIFEKELWNDKNVFVENVRKVLAYAERDNWINHQLSSYVALFCSDIPELSDFSFRARSYLQSFPFSGSIDVYCALGSQDYLKSVLSMDALSTKVASLPDEQLAHLLLAISTHGKETPGFSVVKNQVIHVIRDRHLTELDKKVSKEILDLLLLLRGQLSESEIKRRLASLSSNVYLASIQFDDSKLAIRFELPRHGLAETLGRIDLVTISLYLLSSTMIGEKSIFLVPEKDYERARQYFTTNTFPMSDKRAYVYESILVALFLLGFGGTVYLVYIFLGFTVPSGPLLTRIGQLILLYSYIFIPLPPLFTRLCRATVPEISRFFISKLPDSLRQSGTLRKWFG